tara:strand:+ start:871 stop:1065 length:195 start_codon:yes stop_codon:yes gene_type:complete
MSNEVKSGQEILDDFFEKLDSIEGVDPKISQLLTKLYNEDSLTDRSIKNGLEELRIKEKDVDEA